ncbi:hypothetical protein [Sphingomonas sp. RB1R13]|uniref:hypothetical protein n=1 Tax=Sphingomonas sp. RB1R13 TaxID=3096159 RepID=UPI002FC5B54F
MRDIVRNAMGRHNNDFVAHKHSVANLSYIYDRRVRRLASRLFEMQHATMISSRRPHRFR